nr:Chain B, peptide [Coxsackievirus]7W0S_A Chain A, peptide [Coxsackievirus]7W0S_D Chain D, peptide [Coxsackievirus]7W0S_F Chain F, peptide [Coxsackievirus]7W0T_A Chain A, peptide [Coxsackievirus]7W0T_D Chain D, peptide [Coxsackievirus]7W0T_E Chain E, peptide [Coxsackievirus]
VGTTLEALFQ